MFNRNLTPKPVLWHTAICLLRLKINLPTTIISPCCRKNIAWKWQKKHTLQTTFGIVKATTTRQATCVLGIAVQSSVTQLGDCNSSQNLGLNPHQLAFRVLRLGFVCFFWVYVKKPSNMTSANHICEEFWSLGRPHPQTSFPVAAHLPPSQLPLAPLRLPGVQGSGTADAPTSKKWFRRKMFR